jgi:hypothetical protein
MGESYRYARTEHGNRENAVGNSLRASSETIRAGLDLGSSGKSTSQI